MIIIKKSTRIPEELFEGEMLIVYDRETGKPTGLFVGEPSTGKPRRLAMPPSNRGTGTVRTMAELKTAAPDQPVFLQGFYDPDGSGSGHFVWKPEGDKSDHNGGEWIDPEHPAVPGDAEWYQPANEGTGVWLRLESRSKGVSAIRDFGASPSLNTNKPAIQATLNAAADQGKGVDLGAGSYRLGDDGRLRLPQTNFGIKLFGYGAGATELIGEKRENRELLLLRGGNVILEAFQIRYSDMGVRCGRITPDGEVWCQSPVFRDMVFRDCDTGIGIEYANTGRVFGGEFFDCRYGMHWRGFLAEYEQTDGRDRRRTWNRNGWRVFGARARGGEIGFYIEGKMGHSGSPNHPRHSDDNYLNVTAEGYSDVAVHAGSIRNVIDLYSESGKSGAVSYRSDHPTNIFRTNWVQGGGSGPVNGMGTNFANRGNLSIQEKQQRDLSD